MRHIWFRNKILKKLAAKSWQKNRPQVSIIPFGSNWNTSRFDIKLLNHSNLHFIYVMSSIFNGIKAVTLSSIGMTEC
jgi:hypothetical protein